VRSPAKNYPKTPAEYALFRTENSPCGRKLSSAGGGGGGFFGEFFPQKSKIKLKN
jgi:hypothetical protein